VVVFYLYFSQWLVIDKGVADFWYNMIFTVSSLFLLLTAPILGSTADKNGKQRLYLNRVTVLSFIFFGLTSLVALFFSNQVILAAAFFLIANYFYQFSFVFYNALLGFIAPKNKEGRISGIGQSASWVGQITGLLITLPFATGALYLFGEAGRAQTLFPSVLLFIVFALPMILYFRLPTEKHENAKFDLASEYKDYWRQFKELIKVPNLGMFLLSYFFFNDAIITVQTNFPLYLENVFTITDTTKTLLLTGGLVTSAIGALFSGFIADKIGLKKSLMIVLGSWIVIIPIMSAVTNITLFIILFIIMGFLFGSVWTITRAAMVCLTPREHINFGFSFYTLAERASTFIGPLAWGIIISLLSDLGADKYRITAACMAVFVGIGIFFLRKVRIQGKMEVI
jgi:UMF1 family MFS transporter